MSEKKKPEGKIDKEWAKNWVKTDGPKGDTKVGGRVKSYQSSRNERRGGGRGDNRDKEDVKEGSDSKKESSRKHDSKKEQEMKNLGKSSAELEKQWQQEAEDKKKRDEEERRNKEEEDRKIQEEVKERQKEEEEKRLKEEELKFLNEYVKEQIQRNKMQQILREKNLTAAENRPLEDFFSKLDSSLKKNTGFVKKIKNLTDSQRDALIKDIESLNLTKYIGELATSLVEAKLKMSDVSCAVQVCSKLHQRYIDFAPTLLENWQRVLITKKDVKSVNLSKLRVDLRFFAELISAGVYTEKEALPILATQLSTLIMNDKDEHNNLSVIISFCRHCGSGYAGLVPRKIKNLGEKYAVDIPLNQTLPAERQRACNKMFKEYYASLCKHLLKEHYALRAMEKSDRKMLHTKGEVSEERQEAHEAAVISYQKLLANTATFADLLDDEVPELPEIEEKDEDGMGLDVYHPECGEFQYEGDSSLFEDEDTRSFYERLPDLREIIPAILYKDSANVVTEKANDETPTEESEDLKVEDVEKEMEKVREEEQISEDKLVVEDIEDHPPDIDIPDEDVDTSSKVQLEAFLQKLPQCVNRDLIDSAAVDFCMKLNTKINRKKLVKSLFSVHRTRYDLLPFYARFVATLHPCMPDVSIDLSYFLKGDFKWHVRKKDQINIESKLKTVRFIGELVKFKMFAKNESLHCVKMLLFDFSHHNIEMACSLLESCGRFLYRSPDSHHRTKVYLDVMMRKKAAIHLDSRYITMIENAFYYSNPPDVQQVARKVRPPLHDYIRKLLYKDLMKTTTEKVLRQLRKLNWDDVDTALYAIKCLTSVWNMRYNNIHCAANLLAGIAPYHELVAIQAVDSVLEDIRIGMEINHPKYNQRRVSAVRFLGELYNYRMVESTVVFKTLYSFITFGVILEESQATDFDPPEHLFRLRLCSVLLETCGQYFDRGTSRKKLDCFLGYFQRYYQFKRHLPAWNESHPFPVDVEYMYRDCLEQLRPKLRLCETFQEACTKVEDMEKEIKEQLASVLPSFQETTDEEQSDVEGLHTIREEDELDEMRQTLSQTHLHSDGQNTAESEDDYCPLQPNTSSQDSQTEGDKEADFLDDDEQVTILKNTPKLIKCSEDDDFLATFDKMISDTVQSRTQESVKVPQLDIAVPMHLKGQTRGKYGPGESTLNEESGTINFIFMTKKGNKQQYSSLNVPISAEFAAKYKQREEAEKAEKERMKRLTLDINERQEEEDYNDLVTSISRAVGGGPTIPRDKRPKFQHQKGVPDVDKIFK